MKGFVDVYAYALLPNHFHFCIEVKPTEEIIDQAQKMKFSSIDSLFKRRYVMSWLMKNQVITFETTTPDLYTTRLTKAPSSNSLTSLPEHNLPQERDTSNTTRLKVPPIWNEQLLLKHLPKLMDYTLYDLVELLNELPPQKETLLTGEQASSLEELAPQEQLASYLVSERFRRFLLSHAQYINTTRNRTGSLFQKAFRRKSLNSEEDVKRVISYIHHNPIHHGLERDFGLYRWTSYQELTQNYHTIVAKQKIWGLYKNPDELINQHKLYKKYRWEKEKFYIEEPD